MSDSRFPIGPGNMDVCQRCQDHLKHDVDHLIADELEMHPEILNGDIRLRELLKLRRGQRGESEMKCGEA